MNQTEKPANKSKKHNFQLKLSDFNLDNENEDYHLAASTPNNRVYHQTTKKPETGSFSNVKNEYKDIGAQNTAIDKETQKKRERSSNTESVPNQSFL